MKPASQIASAALGPTPWHQGAGEWEAPTAISNPPRNGGKPSRLRAAGLLGSMGSIGDCYDNSVVESFFGTLQLELLDEQRWDTRQQLVLAIFDWIECWYNPRRRHSYCDRLSPADYEHRHTTAPVAA